MKISTLNLGEVTIDREKIIDFAEGPLAFEKYTKFIIIDSGTSEFPFSFLQSIDEEKVGFVVMDPFLFKKDYDFVIEEEIVEELEIEKEEDLAIYSILVIPKEVEDITANLMAPIIVNQKTKKARQVVLQNTEYSTKYNIFKNNN